MEKVIFLPASVSLINVPCVGVILKGSASAGAKSLIETLCASLLLRQEYKWK